MVSLNTFAGIQVQVGAMRKALPLAALLALAGAQPEARAEAPRPSALDLALAARPALDGSLSTATRVVLSQINAEQAEAFVRGEVSLDDLLLPDGTPIGYFLEGVLGGGPYAIPFYSLDAGGGASQGDPFHLAGTIGQSDAAVSAGTGFTLVGGFQGISPVPHSAWNPHLLPERHNDA